MSSMDSSFLSDRRIRQKGEPFLCGSAAFILTRQERWAHKGKGKVVPVLN
jgi:hypothetical protein